MPPFSLESSAAHGEDSRDREMAPHVFGPALPVVQPTPELASSGMPLGHPFVLLSPDDESSLSQQRHGQLTDPHVFAYAFRVPPERQPMEKVKLTRGHYDTKSQTYVLPGHVDASGTGCFVITNNDGTDRWDRWIDD